MHIGLIGGIGPATTVFYYERIVQAFVHVDAIVNKALQFR